MDPLTFASSQTKKAILPQSDVGKTKGEIRGTFNSYCVTIAKWFSEATQTTSSQRPCPTGCGQISRMITAQWNVVIQCVSSPLSIRSGQKGTPARRAQSV